MATVYLARDLRHERQVAIKVLRPDLAAVIGAERFLKTGVQLPVSLLTLDLLRRRQIGPSQLASFRTIRSQCSTLSHSAWTGSRSSLPCARSSSGDTSQPPSTP